MTSWLRLTAFEEKYDLRHDTLLVRRSQGYFSKCLFKKIGNETYINETALLKRYEFNLKVTLFCQDMYFFILDYSKGDFEIAKCMSKANGKSAANNLHFLSDTLFSNMQEKRNAHRVSDFMWWFFRWTRGIWLKTRKISRIKFEPSVILDYRMAKA